MKTSEQYFPVFMNCYYALQGHSNLSNFWDILRFDSTCIYPPFFPKIVQIERFALRVAILDECQNYLGGGTVWDEARKVYSFNLPPSTALNLDARSPRYIWYQDGRQ